MSGIETAIRNALNKSDRSDADVRERIYQSARNAINAGLRKQGVTDPDTIAAQHRLLDRLIGQIEAEEQARLQPVAIDEDLLDFVPEPREPSASAPTPAMEVPVHSAPPEDSDLGGMRAERLEQQPARPQAAPPAPLAEEGRPPQSEARKARKSRRGAGILASLLVYGLLLAAIGGGGWWFLQSGLIDDIKALMEGERAPSQTQTAESDSDAQFRGVRTLDPRSGFGDDWVEILKPGEANAIKGGSGATVESVSTNEGPAVRISSQAGSDAGAASIAVPEATLQQMQGKASTIAITLQAAGNAPVQVAVECDFASLGSCGRHRFIVDHDKTDILLHVVFDRTMAPDTPGRLRLLPDLTGKGQGVNVFAVRVLPGQ